MGGGTIRARIRYTWLIYGREKKNEQKKPRTAEENSNAQYSLQLGLTVFEIDIESAVSIFIPVSNLSPYFGISAFFVFGISAFPVVFSVPRVF